MGGLAVRTYDTYICFLYTCDCNERHPACIATRAGLLVVHRCSCQGGGSYIAIDGVAAHVIAIEGI
jgi:hypothetical protein